VKLEQKLLIIIALEKCSGRQIKNKGKGDGSKVHFWPFDGWEMAAGQPALFEVYPSLWSKSFHVKDVHKTNRMPMQQLPGCGSQTLMDSSTNFSSPRCCLRNIL
jgi:hypothetical protein